MAGRVLRALGAVVALVAGCGGGGGGGSGDDPRPYELGTVSGDGAPECSFAAWCPDGALMEPIGGDATTSERTTCLAPSSVSAIGNVQSVVCVSRAVADAASAAPGGCLLESEVLSGLGWGALTNPSTMAVEVTDSVSSPTWKLFCNPGERWAAVFIHDGVREIFDEDGNLTESTPVADR